MLMYKQHPFKLSDATLRKTPNGVQEEVNVLEVLAAVVERGRTVGDGKTGNSVELPCETNLTL
jgi:hypothetical protein